jgi:hypothetical protein
VAANADMRAGRPNLVVIGPWRQLLDLSLRKQFRLTGKAAPTFRLAAFHALNHANFGAPALDLFLAAAGVISST